MIYLMIAWLAVIGINLLITGDVSELECHELRTKNHEPRTVVFDNQWLAKQTLDPAPSTFDLSWFQTDRLGSITGIADETGETQESYSYSAFGVRTPISHLPTPISNNLGFTGRELDPETGLYYYRARYYDPEIGRFISEDPIGFGLNDSKDRLYNYRVFSPSKNGQRGDADINPFRYIYNSSTSGLDQFGLGFSEKAFHHRQVVGATNRAVTREFQRRKGGFLQDALCSVGWQVTRAAAIIVVSVAVNLAEGNPVIKLRRPPPPPEIRHVCPRKLPRYPEWLRFF